MKFPAKDKQGHFVMGFAAGLAVGLTRPVYGFAAGIAVGAGKEASDATLNWRARLCGEPEPHSVEWMDFVWTCAGGIVGAAVAWGVRAL